MAIVAIKNLYKTYTLGTLEVTALRGLNLEIEQGEYVAIMGPSGSGKSTLLNVLGCLDMPTSGSYHLDGEDVSKLNDDEQRIIVCHRNDKAYWLDQLRPVDGSDNPWYVGNGSARTEGGILGLHREMAPEPRVR